MYTEYIKLNLLKVDSNQLIKDFIYTVKSVLLTQSKTQKVKFQKFKQKK